MRERCVICRQGVSHEIIGPNEVYVLGELFLIEDDRYMRCESCNQDYYTGQQADEHAKKVSQIYSRLNPQ